MTQDSGITFNVSQVWADLVATAPLLSSETIYVSNLGWSPVLVAFSANDTAPTGGGILLPPGAHVFGSAPHIWVCSQNGTAQVTAGTADATEVVAISNLPSVQAISATALPLPNGAASAASQELGNASLTTLVSPYVAATSTPLIATISDTATHTPGPFIPQLSREIWLTLNATAASGTAQLLRSTDGGTTRLGLTAGGNALGSYVFTAITGAIVNEILVIETDATATYYLSITLTAGSVAARVAQ